MKNICIYDNEKNTVIKDITGEIRYTIQFTSEQILDKDGNVLGYSVTAFRNKNDSEKIIVDRYPSDNYDTNYSKVKDEFNKMVKKICLAC